MEAARMGSGPLSRLNSPSKRAWIQGWLRDGLGAGLRGSGAWQAPGWSQCEGAWRTGRSLEHLKR